MGIGPDSYGPGKVDDTIPRLIAGIGPSFFGARDRARKNDLEDQRRETLAGIAPGADGQVDVAAVGRKLLSIGDMEGALTASRLAQAQADGQWNKDFQVASLQLQARAADRADQRASIPQDFERDPSDPSKLRPITGGPKDPAQIEAEAKAKDVKGKPLGGRDVDKLMSAGSSFDDHDRLSTSFKPEFGGWYSGALGDLANTAARNLGLGNKDAAAWWADYQTQKNQVRHALFGSALTATEKGEYEKADINPGMTPDAITKNLDRQKALATRAARKLADFHLRAGQDAGEIEAALGIPLERLGLKIPAGTKQRRGAAPAGPGAPALAETEEDVQRLEGTAGPATGGNLIEGATYRSPSTKKLYTVRGGKAVLVGSDDDE